MGLLILIILVILAASFFIAQAVYKAQVRNSYKSPLLTASIVFVLSLAILSAAIFFLIINNIRIER